MKPHTFAQMVNEVRDLARQYGQVEQFRCRAADLLGKYINVEHGSKGMPESADRPIPDGCVRIEIDVSTKCEFTAIPWWFIVDPRQNMSCDLYTAARQITGPFFSREEGEAFLQRAKHHFSPRAAVWCHTGSDARQYAQAFQAALKANENGLIPKGHAT